MGNEEMRKWEESTLHFTQQTADILLLQSSNIMCDKKLKSMSIQHLFIPYNLHQRGIYIYHMQWHCILHHGRQASTSLLAAC